MAVDKDIANLNVYAPDTRALALMKKTLLHLQSYIDPHTQMTGGFNTHFLQ